MNFQQVTFDGSLSPAFRNNFVMYNPPNEDRTCEFINNTTSFNNNYGADMSYMNAQGYQMERPFTEFDPSVIDATTRHWGTDDSSENENIALRALEMKLDTVTGQRPSVCESGLPKRFRTTFSPSQLNRLESEFQCNNYVVGLKRMRLAEELKLEEKQVKIWFQNKRMKIKRERQNIRRKIMASNLHCYF